MTKGTQEENCMYLGRKVLALLWDEFLIGGKVQGDIRLGNLKGGKVDGRLRSDFVTFPLGNHGILLRAIATRSDLCNKKVASTKLCGKERKRRPPQLAADTLKGNSSTVCYQIFYTQKGRDPSVWVSLYTGEGICTHAPRWFCRESANLRGRIL